MISYFRSTSNGDFLMVGLSTDVKPVTNIPNGARFLEMDTSKQYYFDESTLTYIEQASSSGNVFHGTVHITENGEYSVYGYAAADVNVAVASGTIEIYENGEYDVTEYATAEVYTPEPYGEIAITENGEYDVTQYAIADVGVYPTGTITIDANGEYDVTQYASADVSIPAPTGTILIDENGEYDVTQYASANVAATTSYVKLVATRTITAYEDSNIGEIGKCAFRGCTRLSLVSVPNASLIGDSAFDGCAGLQYVEAKSATDVGYTAFRYCAQLIDVSLPLCENIQSAAFLGCRSLQTISLPSLLSINIYAFSDCVNLISLYLLGSSVCSLASSFAFSSTPIGGYSTVAKQYGSVYVPSSLLATYQSAPYWSLISNRIVGA